MGTRQTSRNQALIVSLGTDFRQPRTPSTIRPSRTAADAGTTRAERLADPAMSHLAARIAAESDHITMTPLQHPRDHTEAVQTGRGKA